ncbi:MAG: hypothetical protein COA75_09750 [Cellvibrionales bacterium]|nr:MAG: hypothetical protein COA75_09750 [Cellvibrionales bacterium]
MLGLSLVVFKATPNVPLLLSTQSPIDDEFEPNVEAGIVGLLFSLSSGGLVYLFSDDAELLDSDTLWLGQHAHHQ